MKMYLKIGSCFVLTALVQSATAFADFDIRDYLPDTVASWLHLEKMSESERLHSLSYASEKGNLKQVQRLLGGHESLAEKRDPFWAPLHSAVDFDHKDIVELFLKAGADVNVRGADYIRGGWTPLMIAANRGNKEIIDLLLSYDADATLTDNNGKTASEIARENSEEKKQRVERLKNHKEPLTATDVYRICKDLDHDDCCGFSVDELKSEIAVELAYLEPRVVNCAAMSVYLAEVEKSQQEAKATKSEL